MDNFLEKENEVPWVISAEDIIKYKFIESLSIRLMDRFSLLGMSGFSRRRYYLILLNYATYIIEKNNITDLVIFDIPHSFFSTLFYELCRAKGINTIMLEYHYVAGYSIMVNDYDFPAVPKDYMPNSSFEEVEKVLPEKLKEKMKM